jgi:hypothetical protein
MRIVRAFKYPTFYASWYRTKCISKKYTKAYISENPADCVVTYIYLFPVASKRKRKLKTIQKSPALKVALINCDICVHFKAHPPPPTPPPHKCPNLTFLFSWTSVIVTSLRLHG